MWGVCSAPETARSASERDATGSARNVSLAMRSAFLGPSFATSALGGAGGSVHVRGGLVPW